MGSRAGIVGKLVEADWSCVREVLSRSFFCRSKAVINAQVGGWWDYMKLMNAETFPEPKCDAMAEPKAAQ